MSPTRARVQSLIAAVLAIGAICCPPALAASGPSPLQLTLGRALGRGPGVSVTMPPVGLSLEYPVMAQDLGAGSCPPPALTSELERLGSPPIELAGQSQDFTAPAEALPFDMNSWEGLSTYTLAPTFWSQLHCLLSTTRDPLTVGLNARIGPPSWAAQMVAGAQATATNGLSFSLGNEPDLYYLPNFASLSKSQSGREGLAVRRYLQVAEALKPELGGAAVIGPELSVPGSWRASLAHVVHVLGTSILGVHAYPLTVCATPRTATLSGLLSPRVGSAADSLAWVVAEARSAGIPAIISEANSVSCGGKAGVSDTPAAAVWAVRFVLSALETGLREVRFHFSGNPYDPFIMRGGVLLRRPLESALAALNRWLAVGSEIHPLHGLGGVRAYALVSPAGAMTLLLDNEQGRTVQVLLKGARAVGVQELGPASSGLQSVPAVAVHGSVRLTLAANTVAAVTWTP